MNIVSNCYIYTEYGKEIIFDSNNNIQDQIFFYRNNHNDLNKLVITLKENKKIYSIRNNCVLLIGDKDNNFHHVIFDIIGIYRELLNFDHQLKDIRFIIRQKNNLVHNFLTLLGVLDSQIIYLKQNILYKIKNLILTPNYLRVSIYRNMIKLLPKLKLYIEPDFDYPKHIMLINNNTKCVNYNDYINLADKYNLFKYYPENDTLQNQISLMSRCHLLVCELGVNCNNMIFMRPRKRVILLSFHYKMYKIYAQLNKDTQRHDLSMIFCKIQTEDEQNFSWEANIEELDILLDNYINGTTS